MNFTRRNFLHAGIALAATTRAARPAPNDRITVGMIGTGARAQQLIDAILHLPQAQIVGIVDAYTGRVERSLDRVGDSPKVYKTHHDLLADKGIDTVVIATPDHWHKQMIIESVKAGKDVYSEKPLTYRSSEGLEIMGAARASERIVQVGSQGISGSIAQKAKEIISSGKLGQVTMIRAAYNRNTAEGAWVYPIPPDASPKTVNWDMFLGPAPKRPFSLERFFRWRCFADYSGGISTDLFVHLCTAIHYVMDAKMPARAVALGELYRWKEREVPDTINAVLEYPEGFAVNLSSTFNNQLAEGGGGFQILGTQGSVVFGGEGLTFYPENAVNDPSWIVDSWPKKLAEAYYQNPEVIRTEVEPKKAARREPEKYKPAGPEDDTVLHFGHFFESVKSRKPYWEDVSVGHHAAACAHMVNLAAKERRQVEWDFARDDIKG